MYYTVCVLLWYYCEKPWIKIVDHASPLKTILQKICKSCKLNFLLARLQDLALNLAFTLQVLH